MATNVNESIYMALSVSEKSKVSPLLMGNPGCGKTTSVEFYAKVNNMKMVLLRGSQSSPEEILGYEVNDGIENNRNGILVKTASKICPKWYDELLKNSQEGIRTLLFLDEITTASSFVQAALLQVIFGREIDNGYKIPNDTFIVAAGNYAGNLSSDFNLIPPLMNRFCIFNVNISKSDMPSFSRYQSKSDVVSNLRMFDISYSCDSGLSDEFIGEVKRKIELKVIEMTQSLINQGKYDPNYTEMSDIYQDQSTGTELLGFLTPRTMGYYVDTAINMYLKYGLFGIKSEVFRVMTSGLVAISLGKVKSLVINDFLKVVISTAEDLEKNKCNSISSTESQISRVLTKLDTQGNRVNVKILSSPDLILLKKVIDSCLSDLIKMKRIQESPISPKLLNECLDIIVSSVRNILYDDKDKFKELSIRSSNEEVIDLSSIDLEKINGSLKNFNDAILLYKSILSFIKEKKFNYNSDLLERVSSDDYSIMMKNRFRIESIKNTLRTIGISTSDLIETESLL